MWLYYIILDNIVLMQQHKVGTTISDAVWQPFVVVLIIMSAGSRSYGIFGIFIWSIYI